MIVDEIGRPAEVEAADTIKKRGVRMIVAAHGDLRCVYDNPQLQGLLCGTKGADGENSSAKPIFDVVVTFRSDNPYAWDIVSDVGSAVDRIQRGKKIPVVRRTFDPSADILTTERAEI
eukprot:Rmarinus@m.4991